MAHDLEIRDGVASMAYNRNNGAPWHVLGTPVDGEMTAVGCIEKARLGYDVEVRALYAVPDKLSFDGDDVMPLDAGDIGKEIVIPGKRAIIRKDTGVLFGVVSDGYRPIQNREAFSFMDSLVSGHEMLYETAGAFGDGERVWMLGKLPNDLRILNSDDLVRGYILCYNSHDGTAAFRVLPTPTRVVCWNTCSGALADGAGKGISIRHFGQNMDEKVGEARKALGLVIGYYDAFKDQADALARTQISADALKTYFAKLYPSEGKGAPKGKRDVNLTHRATLKGLFEGDGTGMDMPTTQGTAWGAYQSVTEFVDYHLGNTDGARRLESNWMGDGTKVKERAWDLILEVAGVSKTNQAAKLVAAAGPAPEPTPAAPTMAIPPSLSRALAMADTESN